MNRLLNVDNTRVWDVDDPLYNYIGVEKLEKIYGVEGLQWKATLTAYRAEDIRTLLDLQVNTSLEVTYILQGRRDLRTNQINIITLHNCSPIKGWFDDLVRPIDSHTSDLVHYHLEVACNTTFSLDSLIYEKNS